MKSKIHSVNQNRYNLKKQSWHKNHIFVFQCCNWWEVEIKKIFFFFYNQISFSFSFLFKCLMGMFKKSEYNSIFKVFTEFFLNTRIPHSTVLITEADIQRCFVEKVFLNFLQNSLKNTCVWVFFLNKVPDLVKFLGTCFLTEHI